jgi:S-formylglutathione hydrolase FrmB
MRLRGCLWLLALHSSLPAGSASAQPHGTVLVQSFFSKALGARKRYLIYLPPSYTRSSRTRYPVAYLLHGRTGNEADWVVRGDLDAVADSVFSSGVPELILVMPDGDNSFWVNWAESPGYERCASDSTLAESAGSFCVPFSRYGDYLARDLVAQVDSGYRTLPQRAHRGMMGLSMGGTGALTLATTYPEVFTAAAALSAPNPFYLGPHPYEKPAHYAESLAAMEQSLGRPLGPFTRARWGADTTSW